MLIERRALIFLAPVHLLDGVRRDAEQSGLHCLLVLSCDFLDAEVLQVVFDYPAQVSLFIAIWIPGDLKDGVALRELATRGLDILQLNRMLDQSRVELGSNDSVAHDTVTQGKPRHFMLLRFAFTLVDSDEAQADIRRGCQLAVLIQVVIGPGNGDQVDVWDMMRHVRASCNSTVRLLGAVR